MIFKPDPSLPPRSPRKLAIPYWMKAAAAVAIVASWLPLTLIARARLTPKPEPRIAIFQDMGVSPAYKPQEFAPIFQDGRAMRPPVTGTVARGHLADDDHYNRGFARTFDAQAQKWNVEFFNSLPKQAPLTPELLARGQQRFEIYCGVCHGSDGFGNGPINVRAKELQEPKWVPPTSLHDPTVRNRPDGHLFNTITNGIRTMPPYGPQIAVEDRWAIVAYIRALQLGQNAPARLLSPEQLNQLR